jgi:23S rRNA (guanosine2251-2'-O)-methyltransferase
MNRIIAGPNQVEEAIQAGVPIHVLYIQSGLAQKTAARLFSLAARRDVKTQSVDKELLNSLAGELNHQGVVAICGEFPYRDLDTLLEMRTTGSKKRTLLVLDQVQDPGNLGAILRSAYSLGAAGVIVTKNRSAQVTAAAVRASAGASERIPVVQVVNLVSAMDRLKNAGFYVLGTSLQGSTAMDRIKWPDKTAIILGNEGKGIRKLTAENCDELFRIPMSSGFESLNVSAAAAIILYSIQQAQSPPIH